ncbi:unnamed protein product [Didymodactylos carnosus]|uniref:PARP catalytic domain-containing protein n=1 Tax=Didymodactylos carnosus TaxID=1234261 RepID=A0A815JC10_9BILA|nr:unnamed protein product [Didymodactylos carnosus]CAF1377173.1 unnamed protein product [Didymodactylos carnosus]CAF4009894.1 unnamed protein product [Didymodactylos carnosus]CAF4268530.1 unnamed protein product [Didymodactylos carnosus]
MWTVGSPFKHLLTITLFFYRSPSYAIKCAEENVSILYHASQLHLHACRYYAALIVAALHGYSKEQLLDGEFYNKHLRLGCEPKLHHDIEKVVQGSYKRGNDSSSTDLLVKSLEVALSIFWNDGNSFKVGLEQVMTVQNDNKDEIGVIYSQLAGVVYEDSNIPENWKQNIYGKNFIECVAKWLDYEGQCWFKKRKSFYEMTCGLDPQLPQFTGDFTPLVKILDTNQYNTLSYPLNDKDHAELLKQIYHQWLGQLEDGYVIQKIEFINNPDYYQTFLQEILKVEKRQKQKAFQSDLSKETNPDERRQVLKIFDGLCRQVKHNRTSKFVRMWHGCAREIVPHIISEGFAANSDRDEGWYGNGIYFTSSAQYASVYSGKNGCIVMCYVLVLNPFPIIDMKDGGRFQGRGNYKNYHGHYVNTCPDEFVVFQETYILPQIVVYFG